MGYIRRNSEPANAMDPASVAKLGRTLTELTDAERHVITGRMYDFAKIFAEGKQQRICDFFLAVGVLAAEEGDRRRALQEHARYEVDGDDSGALLSEVDPEGLE